jgi:hypothetical protein
VNARLARRRMQAGILAFALLAPLARAQTAPAAARTIAVISIVGDKIDIVKAVPQVGNLTDPNEHQILPFAAAGLDIAALAAAKSTLAKLDPTLDVALLAASKLETFEGQDALFDGSHAKLPPEILAAVQREHAAQLVLVTKYRTEARLTGGNGAVGNGKIGGLGFYIDFVARVQSTETGEIEPGFIAPFAYVKLSLIDVATSTVLRQVAATSSYLLGTERSPGGGNPWNVLTPQEKVDALKEVLGNAVTDNLPTLLAAPPAGTHG